MAGVDEGGQHDHDPFGFKALGLGIHELNAHAGVDQFASVQPPVRHPWPAARSITGSGVAWTCARPAVAIEEL